MKHLYSYKYRLDPTPNQEVLLNKHFGCVRYLYNHFLAQRTTAYKESNETQNYHDNAVEIPKLKKELPWLKEVGSQALQYAVRQLQNGYDNFFREEKEWTCWNCWTTHDRDENAAMNIYNEGLRIRTLGTRGIADCLPDVRPVKDGLLVGSEAPPSLAAGQFTDAKGENLTIILY